VNEIYTKKMLTFEKKEKDNGRIRTYAGEPIGFQVRLLDHSDTLSRMFFRVHQILGHIP
jgi:hypothetical protein